MLSFFQFNWNIDYLCSPWRRLERNSKYRVKTISSLQISDRLMDTSDPNFKGLFLRCDHLAHDISIEYASSNLNKIQRAQHEHEVIQVKSIYGVVEMEVNKYLVVVTKATEVVQIMGQAIFRADEFRLICLADSEDTRDVIYQKGMTGLFKSSYWFYSHDYCLSTSLQNQLIPETKKHTQYMVNACWADNLIKQETETSLAERGVGIFIYGFIGTHQLIHQAQQIRVTVISRMCTKRLGGKWVLRGLSEEGYASNTVETQTIMTVQSHSQENYTFSLVQLRGTIPFLWKQTPNLSHSAPVQIYQDDQLNTKLMQKNFETIERRYKHCTLINLVNYKKKDEKKLGEYYQKIYRQTGSLFDLKWLNFEQQSKEMKENKHQALSFVQDQVDQYGYYCFRQKSEFGQEISAQKGIYRTNCFNSLDRTNVIQSFIAYKVLQKWISCLSLSSQAKNELEQKINQPFTNIWAQNAHTNAFINAGTKAFRSELTCNGGTQTIKGLIIDKISTVKRGYYGNFHDPVMQDHYDFLTGKLHPKVNEQHRIRDVFVSPLVIYITLMIIGSVLFRTFITPLVFGEDTGWLLALIGRRVGVTVTAYLLHLCHRLILPRHILFEDWKSDKFRGWAHPQKQKQD